MEICNKLEDFDQNIITSRLENDGFIVLNKFFSEKFISSIINDVEENKFSINANIPTGVYAHRQYYFCDLLTISEYFFNFLTSKFLTSFLKKYFSEKCRIKAIRYYETFAHHNMQWHTDNKKSGKEFANIDGLIFIFYCVDVNEGQFQYIKGSHKWSSERKMNDYSDDWINKNCKEEIVDFKASAGTLIIYDAKGIHRAKPFQNSKFVRKSVFVQFDNNIEDGTPIYLNTSFFKKELIKDQWLLDFFGFGKKSDYKPFPTSGPKTLPFLKYISFLKTVLKGVIIRVLLKYINFEQADRIKKILKKKI
jgi:hypothetical protein